MSPLSVIITIACYFAAMIALSLVSGRKQKGDNEYFRGSRNTSWYVVAFAMIGACFSGVTFVSVPGMVGSSGFGYLQMCLGFIVGYFLIAFVLIPVYYKLNVVSIYQYLENRFGAASYKTGAWFFFISKILGASVRLFLVCTALQLLVFSPLGLPFALNAAVSMAIVLAYTFRGGVASVIRNDNLKTFCMIVSVLLCIIFIARDLGLGFAGTASLIKESEMSRIFFFDDVNHPQFFWKQFAGGIFTVLAMTGLDQDLMQRSLSCKNRQDSQKNLIVSTFIQTVVIFIFLCLGVLLYQFAAVHSIDASGDGLFPAVATSGFLPPIAGVMFILGLVSCAYSAGGSALTALTTSFTVDIIGTSGKEAEKVSRTRKIVHIAITVAMWTIICLFAVFNNTSTIDAVYKLASYTYGPILGMFAFGILTKAKVRDKWVPAAAIAAPLICLVLQTNSEKWFGGYTFSYELLPLNAGLVFLFLCCLIKKSE